ncbi:isoprenylcysteine carboxylmethyltransferase family protein [Alcaligenaceae bacterium CGII-47]|nr:isoprenylcysteine carboxylmethyltransferase family protein [Alcaligenaceae bacterium CGII-47]
MNALELTIPPPLVMLVLGLLMWLLTFTFPAFTMYSVSSVAGAVIISVIGVSVGMAGIIAFRRARTTSDPRKPADASALVTSGIYRFTRNPMYLGVLLVLIGWGLFLNNLLALICAFIFIPYISRFQIQPEERLLEGKFGPIFISYKAKVRRWI